MRNIYTKEIAKDIIESFENLLDKYNISIPDKYREENDDEAKIFGENYDSLLSEVENIIVDAVGLIKLYTPDTITDTWNGGNWVK